MSDVQDEGGDPACWLHLLEEEDDDDESVVEAGDGDPGGDRPAP